MHPTVCKWEKSMMDPSNRRMGKPRETGLTMVMDKGMGLGEFKDLLELGGRYIDFIKLGFGTSALTPRAILAQKIELATQHHIHIYPGGTFFEVAKSQEKVASYFVALKELGFNWVEISDGSIELAPADRKEIIEQALESGFQVITEIGKKVSGWAISVSELVSAYQSDIQQGADYVIVEARESGENIGIYNEHGEANTAYIAQVKNTTDCSRLLWEAPQKQQQTLLINQIGRDVSLGNISPYDVLGVEALRRGLRADTFLF